MGTEHAGLSPSALGGAGLRGGAAENQVPRPGSGISPTDSQPGPSAGHWAESGCGPRAGGRAGLAAEPRPGRSRPRPRSSPPQPPRARCARSFSYSFPGPQRTAPRPVASVPAGHRSPSPRHDHPANSAPGPGTLGLPPRWGQGLRAAFSHFPGKSNLGRAGSGAIPGWGAARPGGDLVGAGARRAQSETAVSELGTELGRLGAARCAVR